MHSGVVDWSELLLLHLVLFVFAVPRRLSSCCPIDNDDVFLHHRQPAHLPMTSFQSRAPIHPSHPLIIIMKISSSSLHGSSSACAPLPPSSTVQWAAIAYHSQVILLSKPSSSRRQQEKSYSALHRPISTHVHRPPPSLPTPSIRIPPSDPPTRASTIPLAHRQSHWPTDNPACPEPRNLPLPPPL